MPIHIYADKKLSLWDRLALAVRASRLIFKGEGQVFESSCKLRRGVGGVQELKDTVDETAATARETVGTVYATAVETVENLPLP